MLVQWTTRDKTSPTVQFGTVPGTYTKSVTGYMSTIKAADFCGSPANDLGFIAVGQLNYVTITKLQPDTRYYYRYGDVKHGWSEEASFLTAPAIGISSTLRILAWADSGQVAGDGSYAWDWSDNNPISFSAPNTVQVRTVVMGRSQNAPVLFCTTNSLRGLDSAGCIAYVALAKQSCDMLFQVVQYAVPTHP